jgi:HAE1 family hydrophobic/amphiphilic exporter-1
MADLNTRFPEDLRYDIALNTTKAVSVGIEEIIHTLFEAVFLVIIVVFLFLARLARNPYSIIDRSCFVNWNIYNFPIAGFFSKRFIPPRISTRDRFSGG